MNASFNAVQGLETEHACYRGQRQGGENTYRAGERLKNLNGYLLAVEYLADIAAVSDHEEHAAERRADIGEHERVRHRISAAHAPVDRAIFRLFRTATRL